MFETPRSLTGKSMLFRADGGPEIGMGHLTRIAGLAEECIRHDLEPVLLTRSTPEAELDRMLPEQVVIQSLPPDCSREMDRQITLEHIQDLSPACVVADVCNANFIPDPDGYRSYLSTLHDVSNVLVVMDDLHTFSFPADLVVNPNYGADERSYPASDSTRYLLGPSYFIFRDDFLEQRTDASPAVPETVQHLLVSLGGSDHQNVTGTVCRGIERLDVSPDVEVISGLSNDRFRNRLSQQSVTNWTFHSFVENMAEVLNRTDLAITGGGLTKYETAVLGVPSLVLSQVEHQHRLMQEFEKADTCAYAGPAEEISEQQIRDGLQELIENPSRQARMSENGRKLVDGRGKKRLVQEMKRTA